MKIDLKRTLHNQHQELLLQQLFTASYVPKNLVSMVRSFQEACIAEGIKDELHFKESLVERCEIQIGILDLDSTTFNEEKVRKCLEASAQAEKWADKEQFSGQIDWQFIGVNQFGAVMIRVKERSWQVEFSRLQRRISALITDEAALKPKAHQALYEEMKKTLQPIGSSDPSQLLILQGASGLGKSHCVEHYFYHEANKHHQMVAWLSGESKAAFLRDWEALANQLRSIDARRSTDSDTVIIRHWCEEQLGQWLFIVDDLQIEVDWLKEYLPQKGGHALITTTQPCYSLSEEAKLLSFSPLSSEDSVLLLKAWLGKYWEAAGFAKEAQALNYFSEALGGSPALLTQIALLVRKKGLSFERVMRQFQDAETRSLLLADTVFDQLKGQTFLECVKKSWRQWVVSLGNHYPQFTCQEHEVHLKQFIDFLKQQVAHGLEESPQAYMDEELILTYWQSVWTSLSCVPLDPQQVTSYLNLLPFSYDKANQHWVVSVAGLQALVCQDSEKDLSIALPEITTLSPAHKERPDLPQLPSGVNLAFDLDNSGLGSAEIALFTIGKPAEFTTWRLPPTNPYFIPRPKLTEEIAEKLPPKTTHEQSAELVLAAASGMGGIGKTELARHFITTPKLSSHYKKRFWFNAESTAALRNEFHDFASYLGLIGPKEYVEDKVLIHRLHGWFNLNPGWLMIFDNADEYNSIVEWIPKEGGSVLVTTRVPKPGTLRDEQIVKVSLLAPEEAIIWLYRLAQRDQNAATETEQQAASALVEDLGYLPLAIAQVAAYLREQKEMPIREYQKNFLGLLLKDESLIERDKPIDKRSDAYSRRVIASTWKLSFERIEAHAKEKGLFNASPYLLAACSYLAPKDIPLGLLECWFKVFFDLEDISPQSLSYLLDEYTAQLVRYSLCERAGLTSMISIHKLVQEVLRSDLNLAPSLLIIPEKLPVGIIHLEEQKGVAIKEVFLTLSRVLANYSAEFAPSIADRKRRIDLVSHLQIIIATWEKLNFQGKINPERLITLYERLMNIQLGLRLDAREGLMLCQKQLDLCQKRYGPEHPMVARALESLSIAYGILGDAKRQKSLLERALPIFEQHYGPEHLTVISTLVNLGNAYGSLGDAQQEKIFQEKVLPILERDYGAEHPEAVTTLMNLSHAYGDLGDHKQEKRLLKKALRIQEQHYGPEHPEIARTFMSLGNAYGALGDAEQQKNLLEKALRIEEHYYGPEHPEVAKTLANLGNAYGDLGDAQQKKNLLERALRIDEHHYGLQHPEVAMMLMNLGAAYGSLGDTKEEKILLERALPIFEQHYGREHPHVARTLTNLSNAYSALGDVKQQKNLLERALRIKEQYFGHDHPEVAKTLANLGVAYGVLDDPQQQKSLLERALPIIEQYYGLEHPNVATAIINLSNAHGALGNTQQQKIFLERALRIKEHYYGSEHSEVAPTLVSLSNAYGALGNTQQQKILLERALHINERYYGPEHLKVALTLVSLSNAHGALGNAQQQRSLLERALPILERYYGLEHPTVAKMLCDLSTVYGVLGDPKQQKRLLERALSIFEQHHGSEHPELAPTLVNLGIAHGDLGDAKQQKCFLERALCIQEQHYGPEHPDVARTLTNLGNAYGVLGDVQQQKSLLERALYIKERSYDSEHLEIAKTLVNLSNAYGVLGDAQQQKNLLERALRIFERDYGPQHPYVATTLINLGIAHGLLRDDQQQKYFLERALRIQEQHYGPEHPEVARTLENLGNAYGTLGDAKQQNIFLARALRIKARYFSAHSCNPTSYKQIGDLMLSYQQPLDAITYYKKALDIEPKFPGIHHNLACCYHVQGDIKKADACFQMGIALFPTAAILAEYSHFLIKQGRFLESLPFTERCVQAVKDGRLGYGMTEFPTVLPAIQSLIKKYPSHPIMLSAQGLAYYLRVLCYQMCQQEEQTQEAIKHFEIWIAQQSDLQQQETFQSLKSSLNFQSESIALNLLPPEQQLFQALVVGNLTVVQSIIENQDFSIDYQEKDSQRTALHLACISQQRDIIAYLLSKLARFDIKDKEEKLAWEYVINTPLLELFKTMSALFTQKYSAAVNAGIFVDWEKVLRMAVVNNYLADVRFLIEVKGIDINSVDANPKTRYTALHLAVIRNKREIAKCLISQGADIHALDANKKTPRDYITLEQKELLALFPPAASEMSAEECGLGFEKLSLQL